MNKTVNINLANILFHIDEDAYNKLQRYLQAIKRSFATTQGSDEIIGDIEARIAELFQEKLVNERQVITQKEVDEIIAIMGQPEDYRIDEEIFDNEPKVTAPTPRNKKLYRDFDAKYIGGVCSGLEHYLGFDVLWIRLIFLFFALFTGFGFIAYVLLWILVPEAATTSQKLDMRGQPVNISNIERKVKEGLDDVADKVKNADYQKMGNQVKSSGQTFFNAIGDLIMFLFKVIGKLVGILLIIIGASGLIGMFVSLFTLGILDSIHIPGIDFYYLVNATNAPIWLVSLLSFFAVGIPLFFLMYLGLKILVTNLKSIGNVAKFSLLGLWLLSVIGLTVLGIQQASAHAYTGSTTTTEVLPLRHYSDTVRISVKTSELTERQEHRGINGMTVSYDENDRRMLFADNLLFDIKKSEDSIPQIRVRKDADGRSQKEAKEKSAAINYGYQVNGNHIILDNFLSTNAAHKVRNQEVRATVYLPEGSVIALDPSTKRHIGRTTTNDKNIYRRDMVNYTWVVGSDGELKCLNCPATGSEDTTNGKILSNENGIDIHVNSDTQTLKVKIGEEGIQIKSKE
ncbi:PspC domain-containing protein [Arenibacter sp. GZD96]|uniref:PspC domain-containing protein n=1 Tax=Aurantibrevibacter litoralis TaxID=3106030 RepID=UPI002AFE8813|nr:PspC domain-containing protein [Arenibacter sp. GZD-96]MEA1786027.1 PspC domain-containing protein [Arenibacter sp. GZD-96]